MPPSNGSKGCTSDRSRASSGSPCWEPEVAGPFTCGSVETALRSPGAGPYNAGSAGCDVTLGASRSQHERRSEQPGRLGPVQPGTGAGAIPDCGHRLAGLRAGSIQPGKGAGAVANRERTPDPVRLSRGRGRTDPEPARARGFGGSQPRRPGSDPAGRRIPDALPADEAAFPGPPGAHLGPGAHRRRAVRGSLDPALAGSWIRFLRDRRHVERKRPAKLRTRAGWRPVSGHVPHESNGPRGRSASRHSGRERRACARSPGVHPGSVRALAHVPERRDRLRADHCGIDLGLGKDDTDPRQRAARKAALDRDTPPGRDLRPRPPGRGSGPQLPGRSPARLAEIRSGQGKPDCVRVEDRAPAGQPLPRLPRLGGPPGGPRPVPAGVRARWRRSRQCDRTGRCELKPGLADDAIGCDAPEPARPHPCGKGVLAALDRCRSALAD